MCTKPLLCDANYDRENKDSTNTLRQRRFKQCDVSTNLCEIVLYPVKVFPEYYFYKLCFQLLQKVTWTDEELAWLARVQA